MTKDKSQLLFEIEDIMRHESLYKRRLFIVDMEAIKKKTGKSLKEQPLESIEAIHKKYVKTT